MLHCISSPVPPAEFKAKCYDKAHQLWQCTVLLVLSIFSAYFPVDMNTLHALLQSLSPFLQNLLHIAVWLLLLLIIFTPLEWLWGVRKQKFWYKEMLIDVCYYLINSIVPKMLLAVPTAWLAVALNYVVPAEVHAWSADLSFWSRFAATLVVAEFGIYWGHRAMHEIPWLWRFHAIHHSAEQMHWLVNTKAHPVDMVIPRLCGFVPMYALGLVQPLGKTVDVVLLAVLFVSVLWGFFIHANLRWRFGILEWFISTPAFHHWHHTNDGPEFINKNYSAMVPWVDRLFGTYYLPAYSSEVCHLNRGKAATYSSESCHPHRRLVGA